MKHGKKPSVARQKYIQSTLGLDPKAWLVIKWAPDVIILQERATGETKTFTPAYFNPLYSVKLNRDSN